ncbi:MFS transporter [Micromonospora sp. NPDC004336]
MPNSFLNRELAATGFYRLWLGETMSVAGSQITYFAIPIIAVLSLGADSVQMGILGAAGSAATLVFGLYAGVWADRYERRGLLRRLNLGRALVLLVVPVCYLLDLLSVPVLVLVVFTVGTLSLIFDSAMSAYVPRLVGRAQLTRANSWMEGSAAVGEVAGPGLAGVLVQLLSVPLVLLVDACTYLVSVVAMSRLPEDRPAVATEPEEQGRFRRATSGIMLLLRDRMQRPLLVAAAHFNFFTAMFFAIYVLYIVKVLHFSPVQIGILAALGGGAGLMASTTASRISDRFGLGRPLIVAYALPGAGAVLTPLAASVSMPVAFTLVAVSQTVWVFAVVVNLILSESIKQALVPSHMLGRATASIRFVSWGVEPFGALLGGLLGATRLGLGGTLVLASVGLATSALWPLLSPARDLRDLPGAGDEPADAAADGSAVIAEQTGSREGA